MLQKMVYAIFLNYFKLFRRALISFVRLSIQHLKIIVMTLFFSIQLFSSRNVFGYSEFGMTLREAEIKRQLKSYLKFIAIKFSKVVENRIVFKNKIQDTVSY